MILIRREIYNTCASSSH